MAVTRTGRQLSTMTPRISFKGLSGLSPSQVGRGCALLLAGVAYSGLTYVAPQSKLSPNTPGFVEISTRPDGMWSYVTVSSQDRPAKPSLFHSGPTLRETYIVQYRKPHGITTYA